MPSNKWYPTTTDALPDWHTNFAARAAANGTSLGLTAAQVTQIGVDAGNVVLAISSVVTADTYKKGMIQWRDLFLRGDDEAAPDAPDGPGLIPETAGSKGAIRNRTLAYAAIIKASPAYTSIIGETYQIVGSGPIPLLTPLVAAFAQPFSVVKISMKKKGYDVLAVDCKRGTGDWEQVGVSMRANYIDERPPLVAGQPEVREYRVQGMKDNARVGTISEHAQVVTTP